MKLGALDKAYCALLGILAAAVPACTCGSPADDPNATVPAKCQWDAPQFNSVKTDILFVIDNSSSMQEEQEEVANELPAFIEELTRDTGVVQDFRVGVVTTGVYQNVIDGQYRQYREYTSESGKLQPVPLADGGIPADAERFLDNDDPELLPKFRRLVRLGIAGSGQETPFEAARLAVTEPLTSLPVADGGNGGFLRDDARLLVVVVTDEDDCSETRRPPQVWVAGSVGPSANRDYCTEQSANLSTIHEYFDIFRNLTNSVGRSRQVLWASIAPVGVTNKAAELFIDSSGAHNIDCPTSRGPGIRHRAMAELFDPSLKNLDSICKPSFRQSLVDIAAIANNTQVLDVKGVPDGRLLLVEITRANGDMQSCTVANGGIQYQEAVNDMPAQIRFQQTCPRFRDDQNVQIKLFCAG